MKQLFFYVLAVAFSVIAFRAASGSVVDFGEIPLYLSLAIWLFGVACAGFAVLAATVARRAGSSHA